VWRLQYDLLIFFPFDQNKHLGSRHHSSLFDVIKKATSRNAAEIRPDFCHSCADAATRLSQESSEFGFDDRQIPMGR
jgi:hypothetical protein